MLELKDVTYAISRNGEEMPLVDRVSICIPKGHFMAIVGPSGCGKTSLLKTIAGLNPESSGDLFWEGRNLSKDCDFTPTEIGYVPQFSIAYDTLTVDESIEAATRLRVGDANADQIRVRIDKALAETGLGEICDRRVKVLSGGQMRRLGLAMELVSDPRLLLCDEVTSGLDPSSEREIVHLLRDLSRKDGRIVLSVTHSLAHLELYDSILVLHEGRVAYHGPPDRLTHYFSAVAAEEVYSRLAAQSSDRWQQSWEKHHESYRLMLQRNYADEHCLNEQVAPIVPLPLPGFTSQIAALLFRRWRIFCREPGQVLLQFAILMVFPLLVTIFSDKASGNIRRFSDTRPGDVFTEIQEQQSVRADQAKVGSAVSGIIMFQVVLLALMGSNNAAREIAGERQIYEKEKFGGLRPVAYLVSKVLFLAGLVITQSLWMAIFVNFFGPFRGDFVQHASFLVLINTSMTAICLAISSLMRTAEQASLMSIYLVGFQLPLSGAVLALPEKIEALTRPFVSAYWAWSGSVEALQGQVHGAVRSVIDTGLSSSDECLAALLTHIAAALALTWYGSSRPQWN